MKKLILWVLFIVSGCARKPDMLVYGTVPDFTFTSQSKQEVALKDLSGKVWIADFIFTQCGGMCPLMTEKMHGLEDKLPLEIVFVSFSVDPENDTPEVLAQYAKDHHADTGRWHFLTGNKDALYKISMEGFKLPVDDQGGTEVEPVSHSSRFALVDQKGQIRGYYGMEDADAINNLITDARALL